MKIDLELLVGDVTQLVMFGAGSIMTVLAQCSIK